MTPFQAIVLGIVQGATEFLPVSSSGHLILVPRLLGWPDQGLAFDAVGPPRDGLALLIYFTGDLRQMAEGILEGRPADRRLAAAVDPRLHPRRVAGLAFQRVIESQLRSVTVVAASTILGALVLWWADRRAAGNRVRDLREVGIGRALVVGLAQPVALIPGTSRSGITLSAGLFPGSTARPPPASPSSSAFPSRWRPGFSRSSTLVRAGSTG